MNKRNIKIFPIVVSFICSGACFKYFLDKKIISGDIETSVQYCDTTYTTLTTTSSYTTSTTCTTTTENIYKDIMFLYSDSCDYSLSQISDMIVKYSSYADLDYDKVVSILRDGFDISDFNSLEDAIMRTTFDKACDLGLLSTYCVDGTKKTRSMTRDEQESIMLDMCNIMNISDDYKKIILAVFRWETGNGTSYRCVNDNNYGGVRVSKNFGIYQTPEFGIYRAIKCIYGHILKANKKGYYDINSVVRDMSYRYCYDTADLWYQKICGMIKTVNKYYEGKMYTKKYEG